MRTHNAPLALLTVLLFGAAATGCTSDATTSVAPKTPALSRVKDQARPISGSCETTFAPPTLPPPPVIRQVDEGVCTLSHLGRTALHSVEEIDVVGGTQRSIEFTLIAANGDILRVMTAGTNTPNGPGVRFSATMTFVGGTGRFANATGQAQVEGAASFITNTASFTVDGWIAYDGQTASGR